MKKRTWIAAVLLVLLIWGGVAVRGNPDNQHPTLETPLRYPQNLGPGLTAPGPATGGPVRWRFATTTLATQPLTV